MNLLNQTINRRARASPLKDALHPPPDVSKNGQGVLHLPPGVSKNRQGALHLPLGVSKNRQGALHLPSGVSKNGQGAPHRRSGAVINEQGFLHYGRVRVKKLVHDSKLRLATWNIGILIGKGMEIVDTMIRRKINIICLQETKWIGERCRKIENIGYRLYYTEKLKNKKIE